MAALRTFLRVDRRISLTNFGRVPASTRSLVASDPFEGRNMATNAGSKADMGEAYGDDYATRSSEEGMGQRYGDSVEAGDSTQLKRESQPSGPAATETKEGYTADMTDSYGEAYATRSSDEGFGQIYGEPVVGGAVGRVGNAPAEWAENAHKIDNVNEFPSAPEYEREEQGEPVAQKEFGRHSERHHAASSEKQDTSSQTGMST